MNSGHSEIQVKRDGHVAIIEIDRPPNNHVTVELLRGLADALQEIDGEREIRCSLLLSAGKVFCAGANFSSTTPLGGGSEDGTGQLYREAVRLFSTKKPIVAAVQGAAVGAGLGLALVADFRIAAPEARFVANFVKLGFHPGFGLTCTLPRIVGTQKAALMCLTGRRVKAEEALDWGLVDEVVPRNELCNAALKLAHEIAENAPLALAATRATLRADLAELVKAQTDKEHAEQAILRKTSDFQEGIRAVRERRPGNFTGV
ncbi:MAG TPA: enoyl-CoA hydratase/isomerase family protein [Rhizomicrobium sp.]